MPLQDGFAEAVTALAAHLDCPLLAEPLSNLRFGPHDRSHLGVRYNSWLNDPQARQEVQPEWILRFGAFPVTRNLQGLLAGSPAIHALVEPWPRWSRPAAQCHPPAARRPAGLLRGTVGRGAAAGDR